MFLKRNLQNYVHTTELYCLNTSQTCNTYLFKNTSHEVGYCPTYQKFVKYKGQKTSFIPFQVANRTKENTFSSILNKEVAFYFRKRSVRPYYHSQVILNCFLRSQKEIMKHKCVNYHFLKKKDGCQICVNKLSSSAVWG